MQEQTLQQQEVGFVEAEAVVVVAVLGNDDGVGFWEDAVVDVGDGVAEGAGREIAAG